MNTRCLNFVLALFLLSGLAACGGGGVAGGGTGAGAAPDTTRPTVTAVSPANNAARVAVNTAITATFSEAMDESTLAPNFTLTKPNGLKILGKVTYNGTTATFMPEVTLSFATPYTVSIAAGAKDVAGNAMAAAYTWKFTMVPMQTINDTGINANQCLGPGDDAWVPCNSARARVLSATQDGMVGRDAESATNAVGDGRLGFSFTSIAGGTLPGGCVRDNVTGLTWEVKTNDGGLRDWNHTYTNYSATYNPSNLYGAPTDASGYVAAINAAGLCGFNDWRLPTPDELLGLVDFSVIYPPAIDAWYFPNTQGGEYWTATTWFRGGPGKAWTVNFIGNADVNSAEDRSSNNYYVRLVRADPVQPSPRFVVSDDGQTVADFQTNLTWRRCVAGMTWDGIKKACTGTGSTYTYDEALQYATTEAASFNLNNPWRLPNVKELDSIVERSREFPASDTTAFPDYGSDPWVWTATPAAYQADLSWAVGFEHGFIGAGADNAKLSVRLVMDRRPPPPE